MPRLGIKGKLFLLIYIHRTVHVRRPSQSTARPPSPRPVRYPPLLRKRSPSPSRLRRQCSHSRSTQPDRSHRTRRRRLRPDNSRAHCRPARGRGSKRTKASDRKASISARCSSSTAITGAVLLTACREKDRRWHRKASNSSRSSHVGRSRGRLPCRCSRPLPAPRPMAAQAPPVEDQRSGIRPSQTRQGPPMPAMSTWTGSDR